MKLRYVAGALCAGLMLVSPVAGQQSAVQWSGEDKVAVPLSDPSRPALVDVSLVHGSITVRGSNRKDVQVIAHPEEERQSRRADPNAIGMHRIPQNAGYRITEEANRVRVSSDSPNRAVSFEIEVPAHANLQLHSVNGGEIVVENVEGDLDISNVNGGITLKDVGGSVNAGTTNGSVHATMTKVTAQKEMAFTSLNGAVDVTLPAATKANLRLRSDHGDVYSDFDVQLSQSAPAVEENRSSGGRYRISRNRSIIGSINGGGPEFELRTFNSNVYVRKGK